MKLRLLRQVVRYILGWSVAVFFVVLLTLIFSFLGTIICAALTGMMIGAARLPRWQALAISLIFPTVLVSVLRTSGADLSMNQVALLAVLCLTAFWLIYIVVAALITFEHRPRGAPQVSQAGRPARLPDAEGLAAPRASLSCSRAEQPSVLYPLSLHALEGKWRAECNGSQVNGHQKVLEISKDKLELKLTESNGQVARCLCAQLTVSGQCPIATLSVLCQGELAEAADTLVSI